jgi:hypothetical protein
MRETSKRWYVDKRQRGWALVEEEVGLRFKELGLWATREDALCALAGRLIQERAALKGIRWEGSPGGIVLPVRVSKEDVAVLDDQLALLPEGLVLTRSDLLRWVIRTYPWSNDPMLQGGRR